MPRPLPHGLLADLALRRGILLCLDYDGTLAEFTVDPASAWPVEGVRESIERIARVPNRAAVAIVTGRTVVDLMRFFSGDAPIRFSGMHGLEIRDADGRVRIAPEVDGCQPELRQVRDWLELNMPQGHGFWIEDKGATAALHYRRANSFEAALLCGRFAEFVASETPRLKLVHFNKTAEAMPREASKARAIAALKAESPRKFATIYCGDDLPDEEVFAALRTEQNPDDFGILAGAERQSCARYRVDGPLHLARELSRLADALYQTSAVPTPWK